jgi:hypothetical protein
MNACSTRRRPRPAWRFLEDSGEVPVRVRGVLRSSYGEALQQA